MTDPTMPARMGSPFWNSRPIGSSIHLSLCQYNDLSPQLILEDKVFRSVIDLKNKSPYCSQIQVIGTFISDDQSQRLTYVIDRLLPPDLTSHGLSHLHHPLPGEFQVPILCDNTCSSTINALIKDGMKEIENYCHSLLPLELHRLLYLCGHMPLHYSSSMSTDLSFDLVTIKTSFTLTPIQHDYVHPSLPNLFKTRSSPVGKHLDGDQPHFGYCSSDRISNNKVLLLPEDDSQVSILPLIGIWVSDIVDIQCAFVWAACLRYSSLKQRLPSGDSSEQTFLLACYPSMSSDQCFFYEVTPSSTNARPYSTIEYDFWTCSKNITLPDASSYQSDMNCSAIFSYDFDFQRINDTPKIYPRTDPHSRANSSSDQHPISVLTPNTNGSLFGFPRLPPRQSSHELPSWDILSEATILSPRPSLQPPVASPISRRSPSRATVVCDSEWKDELLEKMESYEGHIQSLTTLVAQLLNNQKQPSTTSTPIKQCIKRDVAVQSEPSSPYANELSSVARINRFSSTSPEIERCRQQTSLVSVIDQKLSSTQIRSPSVVSQQKPTTANSSYHHATASTELKSPQSLDLSCDLNSVDILKPIFQFINTQQQKQQSASSSLTTYNKTDKTLFQITNDDTNRSTDNSFNLTNVQQQQHMTSTRMTGISLISNGVQMQFINQQSSTTTVYPQSQLTRSSIEHLPMSPQKSENNLSIEVHALEMKYLEDEQLAAAIEFNQQSQKPVSGLPQNSQIRDKTLSFNTKEYLGRYNLFVDANHRQQHPSQASSDENDL